MKLQDKFPYDSAIIGLNNIYFTVGDHSHYINSESIQTPQKIIIKGKQYLIASTQPQSTEAIVHRVKLLDAYYNNDFVYLFVINMVMILLSFRYLPSGPGRLIITTWS